MSGTSPSGNESASYRLDKTTLRPGDLFTMDVTVNETNAAGYYGLADGPTQTIQSAARLCDVLTNPLQLVPPKTSSDDLTQALNNATANLPGYNNGTPLVGVPVPLLIAAHEDPFSLQFDATPLLDEWRDNAPTIIREGIKYSYNSSAFQTAGPEINGGEVLTSITADQVFKDPDSSFVSCKSDTKAAAPAGFVVSTNNLTGHAVITIRIPQVLRPGLFTVLPEISPLLDTANLSTANSLTSWSNGTPAVVRIVGPDLNKVTLTDRRVAAKTAAHTRLQPAVAKHKPAVVIAARTAVLVATFGLSLSALLPRQNAGQRRVMLLFGGIGGALLLLDPSAHATAKGSSTTLAGLLGLGETGLAIIPQSFPLLGWLPFVGLAWKTYDRPAIVTRVLISGFLCAETAVVAYTSSGTIPGTIIGSLLLLAAASVCVFGARRLRQRLSSVSLIVGLCSLSTIAAVAALSLNGTTEHLAALGVSIAGLLVAISAVHVDVEARVITPPLLPPHLPSDSDASRK